VDDLTQAVQTATEKRQAAVAQAEAIIDAGVQSFSTGWTSAPACR
jgi:glutamyl-tRNA reductase